MPHRLVEQLATLTENMKRQAVSALEVDEVKDGIARHLCSAWTAAGVMPDNQRMVRHVQTALAALGAPEQVIRKHAMQIAWKIRNLRDSLPVRGGPFGRN
jgi:hypothetical protein